MALPAPNASSTASVLSRAELSLRRREIVDKQKWAWFRQINWNPHRYQIRMHLSTARNRYSVAGRRGGKTAWASKEASAYMVAGPYRVWLCGPDYDAVYMEFRNILEDLQNPANPHRITKLSNNPQGGDLIIRLSNGSEVVGKSLNQTTKSPKVGEEVDLIILCEGSNIRKLGGEGGIWEVQLEGNLTSRLGDMIMPTTASGKDNFLYPRVTNALMGRDPNEFALQWPSWANPAWLENPAELIKKMSKRAFKEQYGGEFVSWRGAIWVEDCGFNSAKHVIVPFSVPVWWTRIEVIDPGFSDYFAWIAGVTDSDGTFFGVDEFRAKRTRYKDLVSRIISHRIAMYGDDYKEVGKRTLVYVDPEDPRCRTEIMTAAKEVGEDIKCVAADNSVFPGFEAGAGLFMADGCFLFNTLINSVDALMYHEWSGRVDSKGRRMQLRDEYIHFSDLWRYAALKIPRASTKPHRAKTLNWTYKDLYDSIRPSRVLLGGSYEDFKRSFNVAGVSAPRL